MCHYCGCREMPLIRDYIAEHERATNLGGDAVRAIDRGELARAGELLQLQFTTGAETIFEGIAACCRARPSSSPMAR